MKIAQTLIAMTLLTTAFIPQNLFAGGIEIPSDISQKAKPVTVKLLVGKKLDKVLLEAKGRYDIYDIETQMLISSGKSSKPRWILTSENGLNWNEVFPGIYQFRIVPTEFNSSILVNGIEYKGCVEIYDIEGKLFVINEVDIERYLKSVMTVQFPNEIDSEVMDALAIVERTNAYFMVSRKMNSYWHLEAKEINYQGCALTTQNIHVDRAIDNTRHMVLTYQGAPFAAAWTKDCAGTTADYKTIYRKDVHTPEGVRSVFAERNKESRSWTYQTTKSELARLLGCAKIVSLDLYQDQKSHKIYGARVKDQNQTYQIDFFKLQKALGSTHLKSNDFSIEVVGEQIAFKGFGEGLGVGLCLFSANSMADKGDKAPKILSAFFPNTQLQNIRSF